MINNHRKMAVSGVVLICLVTITLFFMMRRTVITPLKSIEEVAAQISKGNLKARITITTGDEFEKLGTAFNIMADRIFKGQNLLTEKIAQATRGLSDPHQELTTLDKLKSDFLVNMSHELRSPLTVIRGGIDYLNSSIEESVFPKTNSKSFLKNFQPFLHHIPENHMEPDSAWQSARQLWMPIVGEFGQKASWANQAHFASHFPNTINEYGLRAVGGVR